MCVSLTPGFWSGRSSLLRLLCVSVLGYRYLRIPTAILSMVVTLLSSPQSRLWGSRSACMKGRVMNKFVSVFKHCCLIVVHFAHGGLLVAGLLVTGFFALRVADVGLSSRLLPALPEFSLMASVPASAPVLEPVSLASSAPVQQDYAPLVDNLARRFKVSAKAVAAYVDEARSVAAREGLDPFLLIALITVESGFNPIAESPWGAQGLTQVIPRFHSDKLAAVGDNASLLDAFTSIQVGAKVLKEYIRAEGSVEGGLQRYVGSLEDPEAVYSSKVLAERQRLLAVAGKVGLRTTVPVR